MTAIIAICILVTAPAATPQSDDAVLMARVIWAEARGECFNGRLLVAQTILDRVEDGKWGGTIEEVVTRPHQFAIFRGDPALTRCGINNPHLFDELVKIAKYALAGGRFNCNYRVLFFRSRVSHNNDWWAPFIFRVGNHAFYGYRRESQNQYYPREVAA